MASVPSGDPFPRLINLHLLNLLRDEAPSTYVLRAQMPGLATAGSVNVSLHFEASLRGGATRIELDAFKGTRNGGSVLP